MNILFVATEYPERGKPTTGFPNYLYRVSLALVQMGHKPIILAAGRWDNHRIEGKIEIWTVKVQYTDCKLYVIKYMINALHKGYILNQSIREMVKKREIDVIQFTSLEGIAMFYRCNTPSVLRLSSYAKTAFASYQTHSPITVKIMSLFERISAGRCNAIFAPSRKNAEIFGNDCGRTVKVIETPFVNDVQEYDNRYVDTYLKDKKYVLFFGTLYVEKGILVIADILERFLTNNPEYSFVFVGNVWSAKGERYAQILRRKAGKCVDRVIIWEALIHRQLYPVIKNADFVVLPSFMENLSNACIEAMYFEKIVIGTDGASFEQLITHGENGLLCRIGDSGDLFDQMQMAVSMSKEQKIQMEKRAGKRIEKLEPKYVVRQLLQLYEYVIENTSYHLKRKEKEK